MSISLIELRRLDLELVQSVATSTESYRSRPVLIVSVGINGIVGNGECVALAAPTYSEEYADGAEAVLREHLLPLLASQAASITGATDGLSAMAGIRGHPMAKAAVEMALLDAQLQIEDRSLAEYLGATRDRIGAGATIGLAPVPAMCAAVEGALADGYRRIKIKIAPGRDLAVIAAIRERHPEVVLVVDANGAYRLDDVDHLAALQSLDRLGLFALEQPLGVDDLAGHGRLRQQLATPILLDESIVSLATLDHALALNAMDGVAVKAGRLGGLLAGRALVERCQRVGVHCAIGGMFETGLGRGAALALGALGGFDWPGDLAASDRYFVPDLTAPHLLNQGDLLVPSAPGLGVVLDQATLERATLRSIAFSPS